MAMPKPSELLPHRSPMLMLSEIVACTQERLTARAVVSADNPLLQNGRLPGYAALEMLAQACGLLLGTAQPGRESGPGAIVSVREMQVHVASIALGETLIIETECLGSNDNSAMFRGNVRQDERGVLDATLTVIRFPEGGMR